MIFRLMFHPTEMVAPVLEQPLSAALMAVLVIVDANLEFLCEQAQVIARRRDESIQFGMDEVRQQLLALLQGGFIEECKQTYGQIPWLLAIVFEPLQIHVPRGSYVFYRVTKQGKRAYRNYCRQLPRTARNELFWI